MVGRNSIPISIITDLHQRAHAPVNVTKLFINTDLL